MSHRSLVAGALALGMLGAVAAPAGADPKPGALAVALTCDGEVYDVTVAGNGAWTPAHDLGSTLVGVPLEFGEFTGTFTPTDGEPETFTDPPFAKPNAPRSANLTIWCTYTVTGDFPDGSVSGDGSVLLLVPRIKP
jgi:hypothetical protein